jgi:hypothetical protein
VRLLVLYRARDVARDQPGYSNGFERLVAEGVLQAHRAIPFHGRVEESGWPVLWEEAYTAAREIQADAVFLQFFHGPSWIVGPNPSVGIERIKALTSAPTVFTSVGDGFGPVGRPVPSSYVAASRLADVNFLTGMGDLARHLERQGARNLVLMPNGCCQVRFSTKLDHGTYAPDFDVVFIGNSATYTKNPLSGFFWSSRSRRKFVAQVTRRYGRKFGLFGWGWTGNPSWQGYIHYDRQHSACHRGAIVLGGIPGAYHDYYTSDRVFTAVASGIPFVDYAVAGVELLLRPGRDWWLATDTKGMIRWCDHLLSLSQEERMRLGADAREHVLRFHTQYQRCREMVEIVREVRAARLRGVRTAEPRLGFLRAADNPSSPQPRAVVAWQG